MVDIVNHRGVWVALHREGMSDVTPDVAVSQTRERYWHCHFYTDRSTILPASIRSTLPDLHYQIHSWNNYHFWTTIFSLHFLHYHFSTTIPALPFPALPFLHYHFCATISVLPLLHYQITTKSTLQIYDVYLPSEHAVLVGFNGDVLLPWSRQCDRRCEIRRYIQPTAAV